MMRVDLSKERYCVEVNKEKMFSNVILFKEW